MLMTALASVVLATSVVVLDTPEELSPSLREAALRSCRLALGVDRCVAVEDAADLEASFVARIGTGADSAPIVTIELSDTSAPFAVVATRSLEFQETDLPDHRWATVGVVTAALVLGAEAAAAKRPEPPEPKPPVKPPEPRLEQPFSLPTVLRLDLAALVGPGFDRGPWRAGGQLRTSLELNQLPVLAWAAFGGSHRDGDVSAVWWSGHGGLGLHFASGLPLIDIESRIGATGSWVRVAASNAAQRDQLAAWRWGTVGGVDLVLRASGPLHVVVGLEATATWPMLVIMTGDQEVGREPTVRWAALAGLRWAP